MLIGCRNARHTKRFSEFGLYNHGPVFEYNRLLRIGNNDQAIPYIPIIPSKRALNKPGLVLIIYSQAIQNSIVLPVVGQVHLPAVKAKHPV